jgi:hypothetical protein
VTDTDRFKMLFGPYTTPVFKYGDDAFCERHGDVILCGLTPARIPWPIGKRKQKGSRARSIVLCGALVEAVRRESAQAVAYWFGVTAQTVTRWRKALGVGPIRTRRGARRSHRRSRASAGPRMSARRLPVPTAGPSTARRRGRR